MEKPKLASLKELAEFLDVSVNSVAKYKKKKRMLMRLGLPIYKETLDKRKQKTEDECI